MWKEGGSLLIAAAGLVVRFAGRNHGASLAHLRSDVVAQWLRRMQTYVLSCTLKAERAHELRQGQPLALQAFSVTMLLGGSRWTSVEVRRWRSRMVAGTVRSRSKVRGGVLATLRFGSQR
jgi:hypothetical protein